MNQSFYIGAVGAFQQQQHMNVRGSNVANVNSYGFKAEKVRFKSLMYQDMRGVEEDALPYGLGGAIIMTKTDFAPGAPQQTGRPQDYMIAGSGFFALVDLTTNEITLTRNGSFSMSELRRATEEVDENGEPIMESVWCLSDGDGRFVLSTEGDLIRVYDEQAEMPVGIFDYPNYDAMEHQADTLFLAIEKNGNLMTGEGKAVQGYLELSNVDLAEEITKVIEAQRAYSLALRMVQTSDEIESTINGLRG